MNLDDMTKLNKVLSQRILGVASSAENGTAIDIDPRNIIQVSVNAVDKVQMTYMHGVTEKFVTWTFAGTAAADKLTSAKKVRDYLMKNGHNGLGFGKTLSLAGVTADAVLEMNYASPGTSGVEIISVLFS